MVTHHEGPSEKDDAARMDEERKRDERDKFILQLAGFVTAIIITAVILTALGRFTDFFKQPVFSNINSTHITIPEVQECTKVTDHMAHCILVNGDEIVYKRKQADGSDI